MLFQWETFRAWYGSRYSRLGNIGYMYTRFLEAFSRALFVYDLAAAFRNLKFQIEMLEDCLPPARQ